MIVQCSAETLLNGDGIIMTLAVGPSPPSVSVQRAALNFITTLCGELDVSRPTLLSMLERQLHCLINPISDEDNDPVLKAKVISVYVHHHNTYILEHVRSSFFCFFFVNVPISY